MIPLFSIDYGFDSILTINNLKKDKEGKWDIEIKNDAPVNLLKISLKHDLNPTIIVCNTFTPFWALYKAYKDIDKQFVFMWKVCVCSDVSKKDDDSELTECNIYIGLKNSEAYYKIVKYVTAANTVNFYKKSRLDWSILQELFDEKYFEVFVPFYSGPLSRNLLKYGGLSSPRFGGIKAIHLLQNQGLPFDNLINDATVKYCEQNKLPTMKAWHCYSYRQTDVESLQTYLCIQNRSNLSKPELKHWASSEFNFESYLKQYDADKLELLK